VLADRHEWSVQSVTIRGLAKIRAAITLAAAGAMPAAFESRLIYPSLREVRNDPD